MLATLLLFPPLFYHLGAPAGRAIAQGRVHWRMQFMHWLSGQAELTLYGAASSWRKQLNDQEQQWQQAQRQQQRLHALAQSLLLLISGFTVTLLLWVSATTIEAQQLPGSSLR